MYDPDQFSDRHEKAAELDKLLSNLQDCDLSAWDSDFVDDLVKRVDKFAERFTPTPRQWEQLERMKEKYNV